MTRLYRCDGFRPVKTILAIDAAKTFGERLARREYGRSGECRAVRLESYAPDGGSWAFQAFVGYPSNGGLTGRDVRLSIYTGAE